MADQLPTVFGDNGAREVQPVMLFDGSGQPAASSEGSKDAANSTTTPLAGGATFTGAWVANNAEQISINVFTDQPGDLYIEFSIDGTTVLQTLSRRYDIRANEARFDALVKMPGRFHRVRYVNRATAQTKFGLLVSTGRGLYPFAPSERDIPAYVAVGQNSFSGATNYYLLVDLSDRVNFPHSEIGRIDIYSANFQVDRAANSTGVARIGVITRIDGTSADYVVVLGVRFDNSSEQRIVRDREFRYPIRLGQTAGKLTRVVSTVIVTGATALNTSTPIATAAGNTAVPAVGDLVAIFTNSSGGAISGSISVQYATNVSAD